MQLSMQELDAFDQNGFIVLRGFADAKLCDEIATVARAHLEAKIEPLETEIGYGEQSKVERTEVTDYTSAANEAQKNVRRLRQVYERDPLFKAWMENPVILPILEQILHDHVVLVTAHHNSIMTKLPGCSTQTRWHQDRRYWRYSDNNLVSVWLALDEESSENGVLEFIPGSHRMEFSGDQFDDKEYFSEEYPNNQALIATKTSTNLSKGDVVIFHSLLLHRANKNSTNRAKISFVYTVKGEKTMAISGTRSAQFPEVLLSKEKEA